MRLKFGGTDNALQLRRGLSGLDRYISVPRKPLVSMSQDRESSRVPRK